MHIQTVSALILSFITPCLLGAPVYDHSRGALIVPRAVITNPTTHISAIQNNKVASHIPAIHNAASRLRMPASTSNMPQLGAKLQVSHQASVHPLATSGGAPCQGKRGSTLCRSSSTANSGQEGKDIFVHPETERGPDYRTTKRVTLGGMIGAGENGAVYDVVKHDLNTQGNLVAKNIFRKNSPQTHREINALRQVGQLHGSGEYKGHTWVVSDKMPGVRLTQTNTYNEALRSGPEALEHVTTYAKDLAGKERFNVAYKHRVVHNDLHHGNVLYEETGDVPGRRKLTKAHLVDWGLTLRAPPMDPKTQQYTSWQKAELSHIPMWKFEGRLVPPPG